MSPSIFSKPFMLLDVFNLYHWFYSSHIVNASPAVGQYDISKGLTTQAKAALFPKDKRFKDTG